MLQLVPGDSVNGPRCSCCGRDGRSVFGFVHRDDESIAFYYAWLDPHRERRTVSLALSIGDWSPEGEASSRNAVAIRFAGQGEEVTGMFLPPEESPYADREALGRFLTIEEIDGSPLRGDFLEAAEEVVLSDPEVNARLTA